jgi:hypothetical protein
MVTPTNEAMAQCQAAHRHQKSQRKPRIALVATELRQLCQDAADVDMTCRVELVDSPRLRFSDLGQPRRTAGPSLIMFMSASVPPRRLTG